MNGTVHRPTWHHSAATPSNTLGISTAGLTTTQDLAMNQQAHGTAMTTNGELVGLVQLDGISRCKYWLCVAQVRGTMQHMVNVDDTMPTMIDSNVVCYDTTIHNDGIARWL